MKVSALVLMLATWAMVIFFAVRFFWMVLKRQNEENEGEDDEN